MRQGDRVEVGRVERAVVSVVSDVEAADGVDRQTEGLVEAVSADGRNIGIEAAVLSVDAGGGGAACGEGEHAVVVLVGNIEIAAAVESESLRIEEAGGADAAVIHAAAVEVRLPVDAGRSGAAAGEEEDSVVSAVSDVEIAAGIGDDVAEKSQGAGAHGAFGRVAGEAAALAIDNAGGDGLEKSGLGRAGSNEARGDAERRVYDQAATRI